LRNQSKRRPFVSPGLDQNVEHFTLGIHGTPEVDQATIDLEIDFVGHCHVASGLAVSDLQP
jgi:hypothetical protein